MQYALSEEYSCCQWEAAVYLEGRHDLLKEGMLRESTIGQTAPSMTVGPIPTTSFWACEV